MLILPKLKICWFCKSEIWLRVDVVWRLRQTVKHSTPSWGVLRQTAEHSTPS